MAREAACWPWSRTARVAAVFAAFGLLSHFVPSEPFLTPYLIDVKGFTEDEVRTRKDARASMGTGMEQRARA